MLIVGAPAIVVVACILTLYVLMMIAFLMAAIRLSHDSKPISRVPKHFRRNDVEKGSSAT